MDTGARKLKKWVWLLPLSGVLTALCLIFPAVGFLEWFTLAPGIFFLFAAAGQRNLRVRRFYLYGLLLFFPFYVSVFHWFLALYPMEFAGITKGEAAVLVALCWVGLSLLQTLFSSLMFPLFAALSRGRFLARYPFLSPFAFATIYAVFEWCMTLTFAGVPWARLPLGQVELGFLANSASLFGSYFLTFALVAVNALAAFAVLHADRRRFAAISAAAVFLLQTAAGAVGYLAADVGKGTGVVVAAVQGNIGSSGKWNSENTEKTLAVYEKYTAEAAEAGAALVVFPETFLPYSMDEGTSFRAYIRGLCTTYHVTIQCGGFTYDDDGNEYNALFTVFPDGTVSDTVYKKRRLVPFGEYVPWRGLVEFLLPALADIGMLSDDLLPGTDSEVVETGFGKIGSLICFDSIYETLTLDSVRDGAELLTLATNDSWFTDSAAAYMHNAQARLRAMESNRYIVRAADTGISDIITPRGETLDLQAPMTEGMSMATVYFNSSRTLYSYIGNLFVYLLLAALAALAGTEICLAVRRRVKREVCDTPAGIGAVSPDAPSADPGAAVPETPDGSLPDAAPRAADIPDTASAPETSESVPPDSGEDTDAGNGTER